MKAAVLHASRDLRYQDIDMPRPGEGEVLIRVGASGICGSDLPRVNGQAAHFYPVVLGHEFSGVIAQIGAGVEGLSVGRRATAAPLLPCMKCADCQKGDYALCRFYSFIGSRQSGSFADYVKVPARNVLTFDDSVSFVQGAFFEPATVALHGLKCADYRGGQSVAILGGGTIGLFAMQWAKLLGARRTVVFDLDAKRLDLAARLGADELILTDRPGFLERAMALTGGRGYEFVFEAAGQNATIDMAFDLAANRASVCLIGTASRDLHFDWRRFEKMNRKEFRLTGSWMSYSAPFPGDEWTQTADYFSRRLLRIDEQMVAHAWPMSRAAEAFELFLSPHRVGGKVMLVNEGDGLE